MCRIHGYFHTTATPHEMRTVAALQRHGGPDSTGAHHTPHGGVGNNRLAVMGLDGGRQPYHADDRVQIVFNGEIYNHDHLRRRLEQRGHTFPDRCDGTILPALYAEYGDALTDHIDGMYALAVLDRRAEPRLLLATDHLGMKPLYYRFDPATRALHFSSEIPALLGFDAVRAGVRTSGLDAFLALKTPFGEQTMFHGIRALPPATTLVCPYGGTPRLMRRPAPAPAPHPCGDPRELRRTLHDEVGRLLVADVPVAVITSGGLDSGLVTALAARHRPLHSFNIAYRGRWPFDERHFARETAEHAGTVHHQIEADPAGFPDLIEDTVRHLGQPNADPIALSTHVLFRAVREAGFKVALTGDAADEVFGGYDRMRTAAEAAAAGADWTGRYLDALAVLPAARRTTLYTDAYRHHVRTVDPLPPGARHDLVHGPGTALDRITRFELAHRLPAYHLRRVDHLSMAHSVEARLPFCQPRVVAAGRALHDHQRIHDGQVKRTLYAAAEGLVPHSVLTRPKQPFTLPVTAMLAPGTPLWQYTRDHLTPARLREGGALRPEAVQALFTAQAERPDDTTALTLWALLVHEVWRDTFHRRRTEPPAPVGATAAPPSLRSAVPA
ncbi:asparagine synthase (glutamine-hydrolyzing) [Streptomyces sp. NPDC056061]|uniref:asparagine synthase (glutamine-hydrolyzing) n=1 Tax=Streptomyces sp. NPDC056061 TaxID=3345700 RepID=UPI0035E000CC